MRCDGAHVASRPHWSMSLQRVGGDARTRRRHAIPRPAWAIFFLLPFFFFFLAVVALSLRSLGCRTNSFFSPVLRCVLRVRYVGHGCGVVSQRWWTASRARVDTGVNGGGLHSTADDGPHRGRDAARVGGAGAGAGALGDAVYVVVVVVVSALWRGTVRALHGWSSDAAGRAVNAS